MSFDVLEDVNYLAALVAGIAWFVVGALWYAPPVLGNLWMRASGIEMQEGFRPNPMVFVGSLVAYVVAAIAMAMLAVATGSDTFAEGFVLGIVTGVGFAVTLAAVGAIYDRRPQPGVWFAITALYNLIGFVVVAVIVSIWG
jgi:hypothetical protein